MNPVAAHRGWSSRAPENTLSAIELTLKESRIKGIEIDVHITNDDVIVVTHDFCLGRTSNGTGVISDYTYKELSKYDFGSWFSKDFRCERIPRLEEVLDLVKGKKDLIIEIKKTGNKYPKIAKKLTDLLMSYPYISKVRVKSFNHRVIKEISDLGASITTGLLIYGEPNLLMEQINYAKASFISMNYEYITKELMEALKKNKIDMMAWTLNDKKTINAIKTISNDIYIISDFPERAF